jgi:hypothetical protein
MGIHQQIAYSLNATKPVQNTADDHNAPWYVTNRTLHDDLKVPFIKDVIQEKRIHHHDKLGNHRDSILQPLLEQQQRRRLNESLASRPNRWLKRIHSLQGTSS